MVVDELSDRDYQQLLAFRTEFAASCIGARNRRHGKSPPPRSTSSFSRIRGHPNGPPTLTDVAAALLLRHHSAVELVDRAEKADRS